MTVGIYTEVKNGEKVATLAVNEPIEDITLHIDLTTAELSQLSERAKDVYLEVVTYIDSDNEVYKKLVEQIQLAGLEELTTIQKTAVSLVETNAINQRHLEELDARIEQRLAEKPVEELPEDDGTIEDNGEPTVIPEP